MADAVDGRVRTPKGKALRRIPQHHPIKVPLGGVGLEGQMQALSDRRVAVDASSQRGGETTDVLDLSVVQRDGER